MPEMEKPPQQITHYLQKFATAFKSKTIEFFAEEEDEECENPDDEELLVLDSAEDFIHDQKVIIIKPDCDGNKDDGETRSFDDNKVLGINTDGVNRLTISEEEEKSNDEAVNNWSKINEPGSNVGNPNLSRNASVESSDENNSYDEVANKNGSSTRPLDVEFSEVENKKWSKISRTTSYDENKNWRELIGPLDVEFGEWLLWNLFAYISSFEASYLQLQAAHVPFDEEGIRANDRALVVVLKKVGDLRDLYVRSRRELGFRNGGSFGSCLEAQVQENQNKLRALETMFNRLQSDIDDKDDQVSVLRKKLDEIQKSNMKLSMKLNHDSKFNLTSAAGLLLTIRVFDSMLRDARRSLHRFTKLLMCLMKKAEWDLDQVACCVYPDVEYAKGHKGYALLSYVSLHMFQGFDSEGFGLSETEAVCKSNFLTQLLEHLAMSPMETLNKSPGCEFSKFCKTKYQQLVHPTIKSSIFRNLDRKDAVLDSWRTLDAFYETFVNMSSSLWLLHKLAYSFDPFVEIFQLERGADYSMVYVEDVTKRGQLPGKSRPSVGFTVVPGFKIGKTIIQSQVYLTGL